jgi:hypothetical protein
MGKIYSIYIVKMQIIQRSHATEEQK